eukprot:jgi/Ulvmu1/10048/UM059_0098.1
MTVSVKLIYKLQHCDAEFEDAATIGTVLARACEIFAQNEAETIILSKGRFLEHNVQLTSLSTSRTRPVKLMVVHRPSNSQTALPFGFLRVAALAQICKDLPKYDNAVNQLKSTSAEAWTTADNNLAVATNEHLERMLVGLDSVTGLAGDDKAAKKHAVQAINELCLQLDNIRSRSK